MRICYISNGKYIHTLRWLRFFRNRGYDQHIISFVPIELRDVDAIHEAGGKFHGEIDGFHVKRFWRTARSMQTVLSVLRRERVDILHCHFLGANAWYAALSGFQPLVLTVMGGGDVVGPDWHPRGVRERLFTPFALRRANLVTAWSPIMAEAVRRYCRPETPVEVIHGGVDLEHFRPGPKPAYLWERLNLPSNARIVFSPRIMRPLSNLHVIAEAAGRVIAVEPRTYFIFAAPAAQWEEAYEDRVRATAQAAGALDQVRFVKGIPHHEMPDYHRFADVVVSIPSTDGTPMTVLEAMACGTPAVVSRITDYDARYIEPGATVLDTPFYEPTALAEAVLQLLSNRDLAARLAEEAKRRVEETGSHEAQMSRMDRLYRDLVASAGRRG